MRRTPHGVRGLKCQYREVRDFDDVRRTPHGVRGLKYFMPLSNRFFFASHPARGAWIEMTNGLQKCRIW